MKPTTPVAWNEIKLPLFTHGNLSLKDPALTFANGWFHLACSVFDMNNHCQMMGWRSRDMAHWEGPQWCMGKDEDGYCSPDIIQVNQQYIMTFQSWDSLHPRISRNQLFYSLSNDASTWTSPRPLASELTRDHRAIDPALALHESTWYLMYKEGQTPIIASAENLDGPWIRHGNPLSCWAENGQFLKIDDHWHLLATIDKHHQAIARMQGNPDRLESWCSWSDFQKLVTPTLSGFNTGCPANASAIWDGRSIDGYWYRVFCASQEASDNNWGYTLGITRSKDLIEWAMPLMRDCS